MRDYGSLNNDMLDSCRLARSAYNVLLHTQRGRLARALICAQFLGATAKCDKPALGGLWVGVQSTEPRKDDTCLLHCLGLPFFGRRDRGRGEGGRHNPLLLADGCQLLERSLQRTASSRLSILVQRSETLRKKENNPKPSCPKAARCVCVWTSVAPHPVHAGC